MARKAKSVMDTSKNKAKSIMNVDETRAESLLTDTPSRKDKHKDIIYQARKYFERSQAYEKNQRVEEMDDIRFAGLLEQWPDDIRRVREGDPQGARPCLTVDKTNQYKNQIVNQIRQNRPSIKVRAVDDKGDVEVADILQGLTRHIEDISRADIAYDWAAEGAVTSGTGYWRIIPEYIPGSFKQELRIKRVPNRFSVYFDPNSTEPDGCDQEECLITEMVNKEAFKKEYPDTDFADFDSGTGDSDWLTEDDIRIAEYFYKDKVNDTLILTQDGQSIYWSEAKAMFKDADIETTPKDLKDQGLIVDYRKAERIVIRWIKMTGVEVLEETTFPGYYIPVIPVIGIETVVNGIQYRRGIIRGVKDAQRMYNYNRSTIAESLNLTIKAPYIGAVGQFKTMRQNWAAGNRVNFAFLEYDPVNTAGGLAPPPQRQAFAGVPTGLLADIQTSEHDIQAALGMYQASIGQNETAKSGRALNAEKNAGDMATYHFPDNLGRSIRHCGRILIGAIPTYYDTAQVIRILGEDGSADYVRIDPDQPEAVREYRDNSGAIQKIYNPTVGLYDVTITSGPGYSTKREEAANFLTQAVQTNPELMAFVGDYLFKSMDVPYAQEIAERMKSVLDPRVLQAEESEESPEVQMVKQQAQQAIEQLNMQLDQAHQAMQEADQEARELKDKADSNEAKQAYDMRKLEIDQFNAETNRLKVELDAMQAQKEQLDMNRFAQVEEAVAVLIDQMGLTPELPMAEVEVIG